MPTFAGPPRTLEELLERKAHARRRFDGMSIFEKMELAIRLHQDMTKTLRGGIGARA